MSPRGAVAVRGVVVLLAAALAGACGGADPEPDPEVPDHPLPTPSISADAGNVAGLDLSAANRRAPLPGLPDWSHAGYRGGADLPGEADYTTDEACLITAEELATEYGVVPDDDETDASGLQAAIDAVKDDCSPDAGYDQLSLITLPAGALTIDREVSVDADFLTVRGAGSDPATGTSLVFRPDTDTRYDTLTDDGADWDEDGMEAGDAKGGWLWPGRGMFRVQSREVSERYADDYDDAPENRKDLFEGTVNVHWRAGVELRAAPGESEPFSARAGDQVIHLADDVDDEAMSTFVVGGLVNIRAANSEGFYAATEALSDEFEPQNLHMRQQIFTIAAIDAAQHTLTVDKPLEFDLPVDSTSDGSEEIDGAEYPSKASPLVDPVLGVGLEGFYFTLDLTGLPKLDGGEHDLDPAAAVHEYGNLAPEYALHGVVFKWAADSWMRDTVGYMAGSHPVVTEEAKNLQIVDNYFDGSWNKGKGGNGYLRGSRVWDSVYAGNVTRNLRHFTLQWSASGNVVIGNDFDSDLNLHGGWERRNLFELNTVTVPFEHRPGSCEANCGGEGADSADESAWYPIWWGAGQKAVKWSGATGPQNVFFHNTLRMQLAEGGRFTDYGPYGTAPTTVFQFGWDGMTWQHLADGGEPIPDWAGHEQLDYSGNGVDSTLTDDGMSLFLTTVPTAAD
ncbi:MAG TPA: hypothetical protein VIP77_09805 [Jiangellaceae bacterium]